MSDPKTPLPSGGGSYVRLKDGTLHREDQQPADPVEGAVEAPVEAPVERVAKAPAKPVKEA